MPWMSLRFLTAVLQRLQVDPGNLVVYLTPRDATKLRPRTPLNVLSDADNAESGESDNSSEGDEGTEE